MSRGGVRVQPQREGSEHTHRIVECGWLRVDFEAYEVTVGDEPVRLYLREFQILSLLVANPNRVFRREEILAAIWGEERAVEPRTIDVHIRRLRQHLGGRRGAGSAITTVRGVGYKLDPRRCTNPTQGPCTNRGAGK